MLSLAQDTLVILLLLHLRSWLLQILLPPRMCALLACLTVRAEAGKVVGTQLLADVLL